MDRREAIKLTSLFLGGTLIGSEFFLSGCVSETTSEGLFSEADILFLDEVGETILPETERSPGAKAAGVGEFMSIFVSGCYSEEEQKIFKKGIENLNTRAKEMFSQEFTNLKPAQKHELLVTLDNQAKADEKHYFTMIKQLTILGYFSSRPGATKALRYDPIPGEFIGCVPYKEGDKAFADRV